MTHSFGATSSMRVCPFASVTSPAGTPGWVVSFNAASMTLRHFASNALSGLTAFFAFTARVSHVVTHGTPAGPTEAGIREAPNCVQIELAAVDEHVLEARVGLVRLVEERRVHRERHRDDHGVDAGGLHRGHGGRGVA